MASVDGSNTALVKAKPTALFPFCSAASPGSHRFGHRTGDPLRNPEHSASWQRPHAAATYDAYRGLVTIAIAETASMTPTTYVATAPPNGMMSTVQGAKQLGQLVSRLKKFSNPHQPWWAMKRAWSSW